MNNYFRKQIKKGFECDLLESALTVVIGNEIICLLYTSDAADD